MSARTLSVPFSLPSLARSLPHSSTLLIQSAFGCSFALSLAPSSSVRPSVRVHPFASIGFVRLADGDFQSSVKRTFGQIEHADSC